MWCATDEKLSSCDDLLPVVRGYMTRQGCGQDVHSKRGLHQTLQRIRERLLEEHGCFGLIITTQNRLSGPVHVVQSTEVISDLTPEVEAPGALENKIADETKTVDQIKSESEALLATRTAEANTFEQNDARCDFLCVERQKHPCRRHRSESHVIVSGGFSGA